MKYKQILLILSFGLLMGCSAVNNVVGSTKVTNKALKSKIAASLKTKSSRVKVSKRRRAADLNTMRVNARANGKRYRCFYRVSIEGKVSGMRCKKRAPKRRR